ncbi:MAG: AsmA-like C-terminal region-containing protein [Crocinitomicaceae bacterium]
MKKRLKKILKWTGITLLVLLLALILIPIIFKNQIKEMVVDEVNKNLNAELTVGDFELTFISTFPDMTVELYDTKLVGKDKFKGVELVSMKKLSAHVGFWSVVAGDQVEVDEIHIEKPIIDIRILDDGSANYDIVKSDEEKTKEELEEPSNFELTLKEYSISNGQIRYDDRLYDMFMVLDGVNHTGKGDLTAATFNFETTSDVEKCTYRMYGIDYLTEVKTDAKVNLLMEFTEKSSKFTLKENTIKLNAVNCSLDGYYEMFDGYDDMNLKLDASKTSFKDFLSLIPAFYRTGYESMVSSGSLSLKGLLDGRMDDTNMPAWDVSLKVSDGSVKYAGLPGKINDIQIDAGSKFPGGSDYNKMTVEVPEFHAKLGKNTLDANLLLSNLEVDPNITSGIHTNVDLATLKNYVPIPRGESYSGILDANVDLKGKMSSIDRGNYDEFDASGIIDLSKINYASDELNEDIVVDHMRLTFSPKALELNNLDAEMGGSDFKMSGTISEYFGYFFKESGQLVGKFDFASSYMDLDALMNVYPETKPAKPAKNASKKELVPPAETGPTLVPANIDFALNTNIDKVKYNGIVARKVQGKTTIKDEEATLKNFSMKAMGGTVGLEGSYNTQDPKDPKFDFEYRLKDIELAQLTKNFLTVGKLAPIAQYAKGRISSNFAMSSSLDDNLLPVLTSISSNGDISSKSLSITDVPLLEKIEKVTQLKEISNKTLKNFKAHFSVIDGKVMLTPFDVNLGKIPTKVSGFTTLEKEMNYKFAMTIPKEQIPAKLLKEVEKGLTMANGLHPDIKIGELPANIKANVFAIGDVKNPKITTDLPDVLRQAVKDRVGNVIEDVKQTVIDSVQTIIDDKTDEIKAEVEAQKKKILAEAQKRADQVKAEGKKNADAVRAEADKQADRLIQEAGNNPIKKKIAETAAKKLRDEAEVKAKGIENTANKKADDIMRKAREEADKLG